MVSEGKYIEYTWALNVNPCASRFETVGILNLPGLSSPFLCVYMVSEGRYIEYTWILISIFAPSQSESKSVEYA